MTTTTSATEQAPTSEVPRRRRRTGAGMATPMPLQITTYILLTAGVVLYVMPFVIMIINSLKTEGELLRNPVGLVPAEITFENYTRWFQELNIQQFFGTSLLVAIVTVAGNVVFCSMVGYAMAKMQFPGKKLLFSLVMLTLMVPGTVTFVPLFVLVSRLGLVNTVPGLFLPFIVTPLGVFLMRQFIMGIPDVLMEAARIDGAKEGTIFFRVILPLCGAPLATLSILTFLGSWNQFLWPLVAAQSEKMYTLPIALTLFSKGQEATNYGLLLAGSVLVVTPIVILFLFLQRYFVQSVVSAGVK
ncbi:MAG: carbohydrate ABC transporter permease [Micropruina sp.]|uniref:carbohydrate ABC transporter permease n=1 Tax=Micropruina sp. TaxID=2737536 RepID=UPI0039E2AE54